eukprot:CAMPEP_0115406786 /NCGR_PEP_ID=MMETSP0271-20121206/18628_1 /TAXON_ID=71861 /ORGANISM="Scrippsiella trochoidea, Strain CCMP3099" /LENGTH=106 /DNA_ID=CAMNT_0002830833 /DNA_START=37 /DNA_END=357 /DNA_ORIENTATION=+
MPIQTLPPTKAMSCIRAESSAILWLKLCLHLLYYLFLRWLHCNREPRLLDLEAKLCGMQWSRTQGANASLTSPIKRQMSLEHTGQPPAKGPVSRSCGANQNLTPIG